MTFLNFKKVTNYGFLSFIEGGGEAFNPSFYAIKEASKHKTSTKKPLTTLS